jgi:hypothetical protein
VDSVHGAVDRGATSPPYTNSHCHAWELTGARPPAASVPESYGQGAREGRRAGELNGGVSVGREPVEGRLTGGVRFSNGGDSSGV